MRETLRKVGGGVGRAGSLLSHHSKHYVHSGLGNPLESIIFPDVVFFCIEELGYWYKSW